MTDGPKLFRPLQRRISGEGARSPIKFSHPSHSPNIFLASADTGQSLRKFNLMHYCVFIFGENHWRPTYQVAKQLLQNFRTISCPESFQSHPLFVVFLNFELAYFVLLGLRYKAQNLSLSHIAILLIIYISMFSEFKLWHEHQFQHYIHIILSWLFNATIFFSISDAFF